MSIHGLSLALDCELPMYQRYDYPNTLPLWYLPLARLCRPEVYHVRKAIYTTMKSHTSRLKESLSGSSLGPSSSHPDTCYPMSRVADELRKLIRLLDSVLLEGYSDNHDSLFLSKDLEPSPTCHCCGASLFLSYFSCPGTCVDLEFDSSHLDMSIRVCGACYVEGRSCTCRNMVPGRLRNFSDILQERNDAAITLSNYLASCSMSADNLDEITER